MIFNGTTLVSGTLNPQAFTSTSTVTVLVPSNQFLTGNNNIVIQYPGDGFFYKQLTNTPAVITLRNPAITVTPAAVNQTVVTSIPYRFVQDATLTFSYTPHGGASSEFTDGAGTGDRINNHQYKAGDECTFNVAFKPTAPGIRKGVIEVDFAPRNGRRQNLFSTCSFPGMGNASQMTLADGKQKIECRPDPASGCGLQSTRLIVVRFQQQCVTDRYPTLVRRGSSPGGMPPIPVTSPIPSTSFRCFRRPLRGRFQLRQGVQL